MSENLPTTLQCNDNDSNYLECAKHLLLIISERINNKTKEIENLKKHYIYRRSRYCQSRQYYGFRSTAPIYELRKKSIRIY